MAPQLAMGFRPDGQEAEQFQQPMYLCPPALIQARSPS